MKKAIIAILIILVMGGIILFLATGGADNFFAKLSPAADTEIAPSQDGESAAGLYISEVVSSNKYSLVLEDGSSPDWLEITNNTGTNINLNGYGLTDDTTDRYKYELPSISLRHGESAIILCATREADGPAGYYTGFKLSSTNGENLVFSAPNDVTVQALEVPPLETDIAWGIDGSGNYLYFGTPTPGAPNEGLTSTDGHFTDGVAESPIVINEFTSKNEFSIMDSEGERHEWVELKNTGTQPVNLKGYGLSDDMSDTKKWVFPEREIQPGELLVVFMSGKDLRDPAGELHTSFRIGSADTKLVLSQEHGRAIDIHDIDPGMGTASCGRSTTVEGQWLFFPEPTPGAENTTKGFENIAEATEKYLPDVFISEVKTNAAAGAVNDPDWIEISNRGTETVNLAGYGLSDSLEEPFLFTFPEVSISPGEYKVIYTGETYGDLSAPAVKVAADGEDVYLTKANGYTCDIFHSGVQYPGTSAGRLSAGEDTSKYYFTSPTPGSTNSATAYKTYTQKPRFSRVGGYTESGTQIEILSETGAVIYYTTDGSKPTTESTRYTGPITITESTPIRCFAEADGKLPSELATENFLVEDKHDIPVLCISSDPKGLFSDSTGIMADGPGHTHNPDDIPYKGANFWVLGEEEREISFEWFEADGTKGIEFPAGLKIFGSYSRAEDQKSVAIYMRGAYGVSEVTYPFFRDYDVTTFSSLVLRISGQDWKYTKLRDAYFTQIVKDSMDMDYMEYRPCAVYINGEYWGLYNLREKLNEDYIVSHHPGAEKGKIDIIKGNSIQQAGTNDDFEELRQWVKSHSLADQENYEYFCSRFDVDQYMDYIIVECFFNNTDSGNVRFWRDYNSNKYRTMLFDLDWGMFSSTYHYNWIEEYFHEKGHGMGRSFYTTFSRGLLENPEWKKKFIERFAYHLNNTFSLEYTMPLLDAMEAEIKNEIPRQKERWGEPGNWEGQLKTLRRIMDERIGIVAEDLQQFFGLSDARMRELGLDDELQRAREQK